VTPIDPAELAARRERLRSALDALVP